MVNLDSRMEKQTPGLDGRRSSVLDTANMCRHTSCLLAGLWMWCLEVKQLSWTSYRDMVLRIGGAVRGKDPESLQLWEGSLWATNQLLYCLSHCHFGLSVIGSEIFTYCPISILLNFQGYLPLLRVFCSFRVGEEGGNLTLWRWQHDIVM